MCIRDRAYVETGTYTGLYLADMTNDGVADILFGNRATDSLEIWQYNQDQLRLAQIDTIGSVSYTHLDVYKRQPATPAAGES